MVVRAGVEMEGGSFGTDFTGSYTHQIDENARSTIPAPLRKVLQKLGCNWAYMRIVDGCIRVLPPHIVASMAAAFGDDEFMDEERIAAAREAASKLVPFKFDRQGRFSIPDVIRAQVNFDKEVVFVSCFKVFEIWPRERWEKSGDGRLGNGEDR
ncbi:hypothetical protein JW905_13040 [bacterium]|nr:hypothetical protein [candidate division CSSED10-310 bacterium]